MERRATRHTRSVFSAAFPLALALGLLGCPETEVGQLTGADHADLLAAQADTADKRGTASESRRAIALNLQAATLYRRAGQFREEANRLYNAGRAYLLDFMTHAQYSKCAWKRTL